MVEIIAGVGIGVAIMYLSLGVLTLLDGYTSIGPNRGIDILDEETEEQ